VNRPQDDDRRTPALPSITDPMTATLAAWTRPTEHGADQSMAGSATPPPGLTSGEVIALRMVTGEVREQLDDVKVLLSDAAEAKPGARVLVTAAVHSLRLMADKLETLTHPANPDQPEEDGKR
jgi:hypothetical protein